MQRLPQRPRENERAGVDLGMLVHDPQNILLSGSLQSCQVQPFALGLTWGLASDLSLGLDLELGLARVGFEHEDESPHLGLRARPIQNDAPNEKCELYTLFGLALHSFCRSAASLA